MAGRGLFWRLRNAGASGSGARAVDETDSILENLRALLNTRKGDGVTVPDFGIVAFTDIVHNFPNAVQSVQRSIKATIAEFEPRLKNVGVRHVPDENPLLLRYEISGVVMRGNEKRPVRFNTQVASGGRIKVW